MTQNTKKARTEAQKSDRQSVILTAARALVAESGFDGVTMSALATRAGLAKGTLYLYVRTKEEVFALLLLADTEAVFAALLPNAGDDEALIDALIGATRRLPLFLPLTARLTTIIESNLSTEALVGFKRAAGQHLERFAGALAQARGLPVDEAIGLATGLMVALQGAAQFSVYPRQEIASLPEDVQQIYALATFEPAFTATARLILKGA